MDERQLALVWAAASEAVGYVFSKLMDEHGIRFSEGIESKFLAEVPDIVVGQAKDDAGLPIPRDLDKALAKAHARAMKAGK